MKNTGRFSRMHSSRSRRRERGVAAIAMALMSVAVAGAAMVSFMLTRAQDTQGRVSGQADLLNWADSAVRTFALSNGRLPCPASQKNGVEDCSVGSAHFAKGWLPVASLLAVAPTGDSRVITSEIRYLVNSGPRPATYIFEDGVDTYVLWDSEETFGGTVIVKDQRFETVVEWQSDLGVSYAPYVIA